LSAVQEQEIWAEALDEHFTAPTADAPAELTGVAAFVSLIRGMAPFDTLGCGSAGSNLCTCWPETEHILLCQADAAATWRVHV
jgi:hypothetical protein